MKTSPRLHKEIENIFHKGFEKATASFSAMINDEVSLEDLIISEDETSDAVLIKYLKEKPFVFITDIIGDVKGKSYFILSKTEVDTISNQVMNQMNSFQNNPDYKEILLKEIDNVISAAVISEFSNACNLRIYGDVPVHVNYDDLTELEIESKLMTNQKTPTIISTATFQFESLSSIKPVFFWNLDHNFFTNLN